MSVHRVDAARRRRRAVHRLMAVAAVLLLTAPSSAAGDEPPVEVTVDMDAEKPGIQSIVTVDACTTTVSGVAFYVVDPLGERAFWSIGFIGGVDRGIAFGHMPDESGNHGSVIAMIAKLGTPVNPGNVSWTIESPNLDPGFVGPEVQYLEFGADSAAVIPREPGEPVFTVEITLEGAGQGDRFDFYLLDFITVWGGGDHGAFSTRGPDITLDTGGDAVPDATQTIYGVDPDPPVPVPPASFLVNYIDGPYGGGPAVIEVISVRGDVDGDGAVGFADLVAVLAAWGPYDPCPPFVPEDIDQDCDVGFSDLLIVLAAWGPCE